MNLVNPLLVAGLATLPLAAIAAGDASQSGAAPAAPVQAASTDDAAALVRRLGDEDYKTRKEAFRALEKLGASARSELEKALKSDDPEVRWSASLLLDRIEQDDSHGGSGRLRERDDFRARDDGGDDEAAPPSRRWRALRTPDDMLQEMREAMRRIEEWQERLERDGFGRGPGRGSGQGPGWFRGSPFGLRLFDEAFDFGDFGDLGDFGRFFQDRGQLDLGPGSSFSRVVESDGKRESLSIRVDQDGRVTVEQEKDGEKSTFQADSIEALKKEHPELLEGLGGMTIQVRPFGRGPFDGDAFDRGDDEQDDSRDEPAQPRPRPRAGRLERPERVTPPRVTPPTSAPPAETTPDERPRLGVQVAPVSPEVAEYLELEEGIGLEVVRVVAGSAAEEIGIRARDILTEVNGRTIRSAEDVAEALGDKDPADAEVTVVRRGQEKTLDLKRR